MCICNYYTGGFGVVSISVSVSPPRNFHLTLHPSRSAFSSRAKFTVNGKPTDSYDPATFYEGEIQGILVYTQLQFFDEKLAESRLR